MPHYKVHATISWELDSEQPFHECLEAARSQIATIFADAQQGGGFERLAANVEMTETRKKGLRHLAEVPIEEVFARINKGKQKVTFVVDGVNYPVKLVGDRLRLFSTNRSCAVCGIEGKKMMIDKHFKDRTAHLNLYAVENGRLVLMTKDHVLPKSKGGKDQMENYVTCCATCNMLKGDACLTPDQIFILREVYNSSEMYGAKARARMIENKKQELLSASADSCFVVQTVAIEMPAA
jgi:hypothetical protein